MKIKRHCTACPLCITLSRIAVWSFLFRNYKLICVNFWSQGGAARWCIGLQKIQGSGITILGGTTQNWKLFIVWVIFGGSIGASSIISQVLSFNWTVYFEIFSSSLSVDIVMWDLVLHKFFETTTASDLVQLKLQICDIISFFIPCFCRSTTFLNMHIFICFNHLRFALCLFIFGWCIYLIHSIM